MVKVAALQKFLSKMKKVTMAVVERRISQLN